MKKHLLIYITIVFCFFIDTAKAGRPVVVQNIQGNERLVDIRINCIYKDTDGFIWVGTGTTVERYDGVRSVCYPFEKTSFEPEESLVTSILETNPYEYWVGNVKGLWKLDHINKRPERMFPEKIDFMVRKLAKDKENVLYIATPNGLYIYDGKQVKHILVERNTLSPNNQIMDIYIDDEGRIWLLTHTGIGLYEPRSESVRYTPQTAAGSLRFTCMTYVDNTLYIGTENNGIYKFDCHNSTYSLYTGRWKTPVTTLSSDGLQTLYAGTNGEGISFINIPDSSISFSKVYNPREGGLTSNSVSCLLVDDKNIWIGYKFYSGLDFIRFQGESVSVFSNAGFSTEGLLVRSFCKDNDMTLIGTREGFWYMPAKGKTTHHLLPEREAKSLSSNVIYSIYPYRDKYLVGTLQEGIFIFDPVKGEVSSSPVFNPLNQMDIFLFREDSDGNLWIPAVGGLFYYQWEEDLLKSYTPDNSNIPSHIVYSVWIDSCERIWVATGKGLCLLDKQNNSFRTDLFPENFFTEEVVRDIYEDKNGNLLFCLLDGRLFLANNDLSVRREIFEGQNRGIANIVQDNNGYYWLGCIWGIIKGDPSLEHFVLYTVANGMPDNNITAGSPVLKDKDGKIWFATIKGLVCIDPAQTYDFPLVRITHMFVNGKETYTSYNGLAEQKGPLRLKNYEDNITFRFASPGYEDPETTLYEYYLDGVDTEWTILNKNHEIYYYDLPSGSYTFTVRKLLNDESAHSVSFVIQKTWYRIWILLVVLFLCAVILFLLKEKINLLRSGKETGSLYPEKIKEKKYRYTRMSEEEAQQITTKLTAYLESEKPYLNPDLKLPDVAGYIGYSTNLLSQVINTHLNTRYYDLINTYRIREFERLIRETDYNKYTLTTLAEKCGFSSQASFFRFFKKATGLTPNEYIQQFEKERNK